MQILNIFHVLIAIALVALILVQRGAGATAGAAFGSGASGTVFGSRGAGNFLTRTTSWLAIAFFGISLAMAVMASRISTGPVNEDLGVMGGVNSSQTSEAADDMPSLQSADDAGDDGVPEALPVIIEPQAELNAAGEEITEIPEMPVQGHDGGNADPDNADPEQDDPGQ